MLIMESTEALRKVGCGIQGIVVEDFYKPQAENCLTEGL
jgi:hypothetical protein